MFLCCTYEYLRLQLGEYSLRKCDIISSLVVLFVLCFSLQQKDNEKMLSGVWHPCPKDKRCNVQPQAAQNGCCIRHLGPLFLSRNWRGAGSFCKSQVLFYLSESTSDLSRRMQQRDLPQRLVSAPPSAAHLAVKGKIKNHKPSLSRMSQSNGKIDLQFLFTRGTIQWFNSWN